MFFTAGLLLLALPATGCDRSCDADATCSPLAIGGGEGTEPACPDDPAEGDVAASCGIWVSAELGDDDGDASQGSPVRTLSRGIELAAKAESGAKRVYACGGTYPERLVLPAGISLFGGFECPSADAWKYVGAQQKAVIEAEPAPAVLTFVGFDGDAFSFVGDIKVVAFDATEPGGSSIAALALPDSRAKIHRAEWVAGNGADGADGADGSPDGQPAQMGISGTNGVDACTLYDGLGGVGPISRCGAGQSIAGSGGNSNQVVAQDGITGLPEPAPNLQGLGAGGHGEDAGMGTVCTSGIGGAHGRDGFHGFGALGLGLVTKDGYFGIWGQDGEPGLPGQGGGGGGASLGSCGAGPKGGAGGGSGGSGGCGGSGGHGGQPGGSSIGLVLLSNDIFVYDSAIATGNGGNGGNGGVGQPGALGGLPGYGGNGVNGGNDGCAGGAGGNGGNGGNGGGGHGGHSLPIAINGTSTNQINVTTILGSGGKGGLGGDPGSVPALGENGYASQVGNLDH